MATETKDKLVTLEDLKIGLDTVKVDVSTGTPIYDENEIGVMVPKLYIGTGFAERSLEDGIALDATPDWNAITNKPFSTSQGARLLSNFGSTSSPISRNTDNTSMFNGSFLCLALTPTPDYSNAKNIFWFIDYKFTMNKTTLSKPTMSPYGWIIGKFDLTFANYEGTSLNAMNCLTASFWNNSEKKSYPLTVSLNNVSSGIFNIVVMSDTLETIPSGSANYIYLRGMIKQV